MTLLKKDKLQIGITIILAVVLLFLMINGLRQDKKSSYPVNVPQTPAVQVTAGQESQGEELFARLEKETARLPLTRDPFSKSTTPFSAPSQGLRLNGIFLDQGRPLAIINDNVVAVGDTIAGHRIVDIAQNAVTINDGQRDLKLTIESKE